MSAPAKESPKQPVLPAEKIKIPYKKSALTRERIYKSGLTLMTEQGYQGATIRDICKRAHVSPAAFYSYFNSKSELLRDIYEAGDKYFKQDVSSQLDGKDPHEQLIIFAKNYADLNIRTGFELVRVLFNPENEWFAKTRPMQELLFQILLNAQNNKQIRTDLSIGELVEGVFIMLRGVCFTWCVYKGSFDLEAMTVRGIRLLWQGMRLE